jgi:nuclear RNA export factor
MQRVQHAPRGPRNGPSTTRTSRGGIQKRKAAPGPVRVDKDGDLDMDAAAGAAGRGKSGKGRVASSVPTGPRGRGGLSRARSTQHNIDRTKNNIERGIRNQNVKVRDAHNPSTAMIQIDGLQNSKAASNSDGGLQSLESFLERKASAMDSASNRQVKIKKVCLSP